MIRVLLADDHAILRQGVRSLLELTREVEVVAEAETGCDALAAILQHHPAVALVDVRMPGLSGVEVVTELRKAGDDTPVVLLTTFDDDATLLAGVRAGISGFLLKDVGVDTLLAALKTVSAGGTLVLPAVTDKATRYVVESPAQFDASELPDRLTPRETEVLRLMAGGYSNREIADALGTSEGTVKNQASSVLGKLGVRDRTRAVFKALELGWLTGRKPPRKS
ncbi:MAG: response regulator [Polyangiaceae bacterium]